MLKSTHPSTDTVNDYRAMYGYLGPALHAAVTKLRQATVMTAVSSSQSSAVTGLLSRPTAAVTLPFLQVTHFSVTLLCIACARNNASDTRSGNLYQKLTRVSVNLVPVFSDTSFLHGIEPSSIPAQKLWHLTRTVQRDWLECCFTAISCDELASNFSCKFLERVSPA